MKPARWRRHLNIFPSASRNTDIQEASCPHPYPLPYICHLPTHRSVPPYTGRGAVLLIEPNFDRSALLYHSPFLWPPQTSGKWYVGEISTWRAYSVPSATCPSLCNASLPHRSAPHHPHPWPPTRCDAKIRETIFKRLAKISIMKFIKRKLIRVRLLDVYYASSTILRRSTRYYRYDENRWVRLNNIDANAEKE